jgi:hypothetical protein
LRHERRIQMTRSEALEQIAIMILENTEYPRDCASMIMHFIEQARSSTHQADEWEPESAE